MLYKKYRPSSIKYVLLLLICFLLFITGLQIPRISTLTTILLPVLAIVDKLMGWQLFSLNKSLLKQTKFIQPLLILTIFCIIYWTTINDYGFLDKEKSWLSYVAQIMRIVSFYIVGFSLNYPQLPAYPYNTIIVMTSLIVGTYTNSVLSVLKTLQISPSLIEQRLFIDYWTGNELPGTATDISFCLALPYIVVVFWGYKKEYKLFYILFALLSAFLAYNSFYFAALLQGRLPFIATVISFITVGFLLNLKSKLKLISIPLFLGLFTAISIGVNIIESTLTFLLSQFGTFNKRFLSEGTDSSRFEMYSIALEKIWQYPFGGREFDLIYSKWVHNLWLDVAYDAGLFPMFLILLYHVLHIKYFFPVFNSQLPKIVIVYLLVMTFAIFLMMLLGPIIQGSIFIFGLTCFFLGVIARLSGEVEISKKYQLSSQRSLYSKSI